VQAVTKGLKREMRFIKQKFQGELEEKLSENMRLKAQVAALKENCDQQVYLSLV
jgi:hypothetical protein